MAKFLIPVFALGFLLCPSLSAQPGTDKKIEALEKSLSAEQKRLLQDYVDVLARREILYADPAGVNPVPDAAQFRAHLMKQIAGMSAESAKAYWRHLPYTLKQHRRELDPLHLTAEERKAAGQLPAAAKDEVAKLLSADLDEVLAARRKILVHGPACRALVVDQLAKLAADSPKRLHHRDMLARLASQESHERLVRITETALQKASKLEKARGKAVPTNSTIAVLNARNLGNFSSRDPYGEWCYYNFLKHNHEYTAGVGLAFGNGVGDPLGINFYGGQDNRIKSLGAVKFAEVKTAPGPATTAKWSNDRDGPRITAVVGHVYILHLVDPRDQIDFAVKFQIVDMSSDEWIIIEWQRIPQEN